MSISKLAETVFPSHKNGHAELVEASLPDSLVTTLLACESIGSHAERSEASCVPPLFTMLCQLSMTAGCVRLNNVAIKLS